jgi:hypothetical protein
VSPLWRDEVSIYLAPRRIVLARRARGPRPRIVASTEVAVAGGSSADSGPVFAKLALLLADAAWQDADARVVVGDSWARYAVVPASGQALDTAARHAHARYVLVDTYGEAVAAWQVLLTDVPPSRSSVACAMAADLPAVLGTTLAPARLKLKSLQPRLAVAFNAWRRRLPRDDAWFITLQDDWLSAVHLTRGAWDRVHAARLSADVLVELERMRAYGRLSSSGGRMLVEAPPWMRARVRRIGTDLEWLESGAPDGGAPHEIGLLLRAGT